MDASQRMLGACDTSEQPEARGREAVVRKGCVILDLKLGRDDGHSHAPDPNERAPEPGIPKWRVLLHVAKNSKQTWGSC